MSKDEQLSIRPAVRPSVRPALSARDRTDWKNTRQLI